MRIKKIVTVLLAALILLSVCGCGNESEAQSQVIDVEYIPAAITSESDVQLRYNPDRGWRGEAYVNVSGTDGDGQTFQSDPTINVRSFFKKYSDYNPQLCQTYFYLTGYKDTPTISQDGLDRIQQVFDCAKELGIKLVVRFAYQGDMQGTGEASDEIMLAHMKQLKPILEKNIDLINVVEAGFLGSWGEWHSYKMQHDEEALLRGIIDMVPEPLYIQVRYPGVKNLIDPTETIYSRMGFHDDSFFGYRYCASAATLNPGESDWNQVMEEAAFTPTGGETFWGYEHNEEIDGYDSILQFSAFRQNIFSIYHSFIEDGYDKDYAMMEWQTEEILPEWLDNNHIFYAPGWFKDADGNTVKRTVFDYVTDYLGYKLEMRNVQIKGNLTPGGTLETRLEIVNYGFSAAFNMYSGYAVLDENDNDVSEIEAGKPSSWNSRSSRDYSNTELVTHKVLSNIELPKEHGKYKLAFYLRNSAGQGARFGNTLTYKNGYTVLYEFEY